MHSPRCRYGRLKCRGNPVPAVVSSRRTRILQREVRTFSQQVRTVTGELERASETLELYRQAYPRDYRAASNLANVDSMLGQHEKGVEAAREALRLNSPSAATRVNLAENLPAPEPICGGQGGNAAKARKAYEDFFTLWKDAEPDLAGVY